MTIVVNGSGTITGISQGGLNDNIITQSELANTGVAGNGPAFSAYLGSTQSVSANTSTKIAFASEVFDTASCFDTTTYRFTPNVAGYYQFNLNFQSGGSPTIVIGTIAKNGNLTGAGLSFRGSRTDSTNISYANSVASVAAALVYLNGTTDYVEFYGYTTATSFSGVPASNDYCWAQGVLVRAA